MILHNLTKIKLFRIALWFTYPIAWLLFLPVIIFRKRRAELFFFLDRYSIGGAQKIHLDVLDSASDTKKHLYFTRKSPDNKLRDVFFKKPNTIARDVHVWCDYLLFRLFSVHYFAFLLNSYNKSVVFTSNSTFFYDVLPFINKSRVVVIEMLHNFTYGKKGMEFFGLATHRYIDLRVVYDPFTLENLNNQYRKYNIANEYLNRIRILEYGVNIPPLYSEKSLLPPLKVLYAGRGARQKRIWLLNQIAEHFIKLAAPVQFTFAGSMTRELSDYVKQNSIVYEEIGEQERMNTLFRENHAILLTSDFEGFPVVIKESMAFGCIPVVTALPGNKAHLQHLSNAMLIENYDDENFVIAEGIRHLNTLMNNDQLVSSLSAAAYDYASNHFRKDGFLAEFKSLLVDQLHHST
jgi:glycosyltransferase involved in cell wall biosynthesis